VGVRDRWDLSRRRHVDFVRVTSQACPF